MTKEESETRAELVLSGMKGRLMVDAERARPFIAFALQQAAADEREACANLIDIDTRQAEPAVWKALRDAANRIRARST